MGGRIILIRNIGLKRIAVIGFIALSLMVAGGRLLAAIKPTTTADLLLSTLDALDSPHQPCKPVGLQSMMSMDGLLPCMNQPAIQPVAHLVGKLCVSFEWFCTESPWSSAMNKFLQKHHLVSDVMLDEDAVTFLGERDDLSWRVQMLFDQIQSFDPQQIKILFSAIEVAQKELFIDAMNRKQGAIGTLDDEAADRFYESVETILAKYSDKLADPQVQRPILERFKRKIHRESGAADVLLEHETSK